MSWSMMGRDLEEYWMERQVAYDEQMRAKLLRVAGPAEQDQKDTSLQSLFPGDAKKGAGLFKVSISMPLRSCVHKLICL
jgi:cytochrome c